MFNRRLTAAKIESLQSRIDSMRDQAARIRERASSPVRSSLSETHSNSHDIRKREAILTENIDAAAEIEHEADQLQLELDALREEIRHYLETDEKMRDFRNSTTRSVIKYRLLWSCSWEEAADLSGYSKKTCQDKYYKWLQS